jgi:hypothetical protein
LKLIVPEQQGARFPFWKLKVSKYRLSLFTVHLNLLD